MVERRLVRPKMVDLDACSVYSVRLGRNDGLQTACGSSDHPEAPPELRYQRSGQTHGSRWTVREGGVRPQEHTPKLSNGLCLGWRSLVCRDRSLRAAQQVPPPTPIYYCSTGVEYLCSNPAGKSRAEGYLMPAGCKRIYLATDSWRGNCVHGQARHPSQVRSSFNI
jgi:hypothetical protein